MSECCNPMTGKCEQGHGCPARETPQDKAARHFWDASPPGYYELIDAPGNALDDFMAWWGALPWYAQAWYVCAAVVACVLVAGVVVGFAK